MKGVVLLATAAVAAVLYSLQSRADTAILDEDYRRVQIAKEVNSNHPNMQSNTITQINSMKLSWEASDYLEEREQISFKTGLLEGNSANLMAAHGQGLLGMSSFSTEQVQSVPESFDARTAWPDCESIRDIRNQAKCGSCWAFSAATVMSDRLCIASGQKVQTRLAPRIDYVFFGFATTNI